MSLFTDPLMREQAVRVSPFQPQDHYILFALTVEFAFINVYRDGQPTPEDGKQQCRAF